MSVRLSRKHKAEAEYLPPTKTSVLYTKLNHLVSDYLTHLDTAADMIRYEISTMSIDTVEDAARLVRYISSVHDDIANKYIRPMKGLVSAWRRP
jgi:hypothetical protein